MRELREDTFSWNKNNDAYVHVERILDIVTLFNIPRVTHEVVMLCVLPITLTGDKKRWVDKLSPRIINTWDLIKKAFIQRYCPPSKTTKQLEEIHIFKQEGDVTLYQAWESLWRDMKKLKENVHAIQVGCENCGGAHLNKECPLHEEVKNVVEVNYYVAPYEPSIPFPRHLEQHAEEALVHKAMESLKRIKVNRPLFKEIRQTDDCAKHIKNLVMNKSRTSKNEDVKMNTRCSSVLQN
ncbi:hypothetical protein Tco_1436589 [Tanacetum coccineum]